MTEVQPSRGRRDEIMADNVRAFGAIYMAWQLEELRLFDVVERLVERFVRGMLAIRDESGAETLEQYHRERDERLMRQERFALYSRLLGAEGADSQSAAPNREFDELWRRFLSALANYDHERRTATRSGAPPRSVRGQVRTAGRRLAANAAAAVSSVSELAVRRLIDQTQQALEIVKTPAILSAYGVQSPWEVIDRVAASELAAAVPNISRHRTMADAGRAILDLLAASPDWWSAEDPERVLAPDIHPKLVRHAERWLKAASS